MIDFPKYDKGVQTSKVDNNTTTSAIATEVQDPTYTSMILVISVI